MLLLSLLLPVAVDVAEFDMLLQQQHQRADEGSLIEPICAHLRQQSSELRSRRRSHNHSHSLSVIVSVIAVCAVAVAAAVTVAVGAGVEPLDYIIGNRFEICLVLCVHFYINYLIRIFNSTQHKTLPLPPALQRPFCYLPACWPN